MSVIKVAGKEIRSRGKPRLCPVQYVCEQVNVGTQSVDQYTHCHTKREHEVNQTHHQ